MGACMGCCTIALFGIFIFGVMFVNVCLCIYVWICVVMTQVVFGFGYLACSKYCFLLW